MLYTSYCRNAGTLIQMESNPIKQTLIVQRVHIDVWNSWPSRFQRPWAACFSGSVMHSTYNLTMHWNTAFRLRMISKFNYLFNTDLIFFSEILMIILISTTYISCTSVLFLKICNFLLLKWILSLLLNTYVILIN